MLLSMFVAKDNQSYVLDGASIPGGGTNLDIDLIGLAVAEWKWEQPK